MWRVRRLAFPKFSWKLCRPPRHSGNLVRVFHSWYRGYAILTAKRLRSQLEQLVLKVAVPNRQFKVSLSYAAIFYQYTTNKPKVRGLERWLSG